MEANFVYESTEEFITKWTVIDDSKYVGEEDWLSNFMFRNEIIILSIIAVCII